MTPTRRTASDSGSIRVLGGSATWAPLDLDPAKKTVSGGRNASPGAHQGVVAAFVHLEQANAVAEGVGEVGDVAPGFLARRSFENGAGIDRAADGTIDILDDEIEVNGRPMPREDADALK